VLIVLAASTIGIVAIAGACPACHPQESNWLPAPNGPFYAIMRIYQPKPEVVSGAWKSPPLQKVN
jgi:hypothetical protein